MRCTHCATTDLVVIHLTISDENVALYRCPRCDVRMWSGVEGAMSKEGLLDLVRASR